MQIEEMERWAHSDDTNVANTTPSKVPEDLVAPAAKPLASAAASASASSEVVGPALRAESSTPPTVAPPHDPASQSAGSQHSSWSDEMDRVAPLHPSNPGTVGDKDDVPMDYPESTHGSTMDQDVEAADSNDGYNHAYDVEQAEDLDAYLQKRNLKDVPTANPYTYGTLATETTFLHHEKGAFYVRDGKNFLRLPRWPLPHWVDSPEMADKYMDWLHAVRNYDGLQHLELMLDSSDTALKACEQLVKHYEKCQRENRYDVSEASNLKYWMARQVRLEEEADEADRIRQQKDEQVSGIPPRHPGIVGPSTRDPPPQPQGVQLPPAAPAQVGQGVANPNLASGSGPNPNMPPPASPAITYKAFEQKKQEVSNAIREAESARDAAYRDTKALLSTRTVDITGGLKPGNALRWTTKLSEPFRHMTACLVCGSMSHLEDKCSLTGLKASTTPAPTETVEEDSIEAMLKKLRGESALSTTATTTSANHLRCAYRLCPNPVGSHLTAACELLHNRCSKCGHRGHQPTTKYGDQLVCIQANDKDRHPITSPAFLGAMFEDVAEEGVFTKQRRVEIAAGFHRIRGNMESHLATLIGYDELTKAKTSGVNECLDGMVACLQKHFPKCKRFIPSPADEQQRFDDYVLRASNAIRREEDALKELVEIHYNARESLHQMSKKAVGTMKDMVIRQKNKHHDEFMKAFTKARPVFERAERRISGREPLLTRENFVGFFGERIISALQPPKGPRVDFLTAAPASVPAPTTSSPYSAVVASSSKPTTPSTPPPSPAPTTTSTSSTSGKRSATTSATSSPSASPAPKRKDMKDSAPRTGLHGFKRLDAVKDRANYRKVYEHINSNAPKPDYEVTRRVPIKEVKAMTEKAHLILNKAKEDKYFWDQDEIPHLSQEDIASFPVKLIFWPNLDNTELWAKTRFREGEIVYAAGAMWFGWSKSNSRFEYLQQDPTRGTPRGKDRSSSGSRDRSGRAGRSGGYGSHPSRRT